MKLNIGCNQDIRKGYINLDQAKFNSKVDIMHNLEEFPYPFEDNIFEEIYARYVLEHIMPDKRIGVLKELHRICKNNAIIKIKVPYKDKIYRSIDHKGNGFNLFTFPNLCNQRDYIMKERFKIIKQDHDPTNFGKLIPSKRLRELVSHFINEIIENIIVELKIIK